MEDKSYIHQTEHLTGEELHLETASGRKIYPFLIKNQEYIFDKKIGELEQTPQM